MNKHYYELTAQPSQNYELYLDLILNITENALEELDGKIIIRSEDSLQDIYDGIAMFTKNLQENNFKSQECKLTLETKENIDWIEQYKKNIQPIAIGRFYIRPSWCEAKNENINIIIDPALAFGSGHHETTSSCVYLIDKYVSKDDKVLDVGTGSGILAITCAKIGSKVDICDTDELCIENSTRNFELNEVKYEDNWLGSVANIDKKYDVVIANIITDILLIISAGLNKCVKDGGKLILSGILDKDAHKIVAKFKDFKVLEKIEKNEWVTIIFTKEKDD